MKLRFLVFFAIFVVLACKKDPVVFENNTIPDYNGISTLKVENYINRLFIDLIGREPLDIEMDAEVEVLESNGLSVQSRINLIDKLTIGTDSIEGDTTYQNSFYWKLYENTKARLLEGASDDYINNERGIFLFNALNDSLSGNVEGYTSNKSEADKLTRIIQSRTDLMAGTISPDEMYRRMMYNSIYDEINMNSFNFINATFDNTFYRFPTTAEFEEAFQVIEFNESAVLFGQVISNKLEYLDVITLSTEFDNGLVQWSYQSLLGRIPSTNEAYNSIELYQEEQNIIPILKTILKSDEYAGFD